MTSVPRNPSPREETLLKPGQLRSCLQKATARGLSTGALVSIPTTFETLMTEGIPFQLRLLKHFQRKEAARAIQIASKEIGRGPSNPFLPYEEDLFVADLSQTHVAVLNKFNIIEDHMLIITREFEAQQDLLTLDDFWAAARCLQELDGLVFFNGGEAAGASQPHKHLQLVPLPLSEEFSFPLEALWSRAFVQKTKWISAFPFLHAIEAFERPWGDDLSDLARALYELYRQLLFETGLLNAPDGVGRSALGPYNLLFTRAGMFVVPRKEEFFEGISVNSLGFVGGLLAHDEDQRKILCEAGLIEVLSSVSVHR